jgi:hypothetical protein
MDQKVDRVTGEVYVLLDHYRPHDPVYADPAGPGVSMTRQEFAEDADINVIMKRFETQGVWPPLPPGPPEYLDVSSVPDLMGALNFVKSAEHAFMKLHANVRREFDNDPLRFVAFAEDPVNLGKMREWGLAPPAPAPEAPPAPSAPSAPAPAPPSGGAP